MPGLYDCTKCSKKTFTLKKLLQHIGLVHAHEPHFGITCVISNCQSAFSKYHSFRRHVYRKHKVNFSNCSEVTEDHIEELVELTHSISNCSEVTGEHIKEQVESTDTVQPTVPSMDSLLDNLRDHLFSFILKCSEKNNLSLSVQQDIVNDLNFLLCFFKENYDSFISYHLDKNGFQVSDCPELEQVLSTSDFFQKACDSIQSPFMIK